MGKKTASSPKKTKKVLPPTIPEIDQLEDRDCRIDDYVKAVSAYVVQSPNMTAGQKKAGQIRLSNALGRSLTADLQTALPLKGVIVGERKVSGALRTANADVSEYHDLDGLRLAIELKPVNLAVGRAIWNRFGDLRTFAVNIHLKFPFAVVGGVLVVPTFEQVGTPEAKKAEGLEKTKEEKPDELDELSEDALEASYTEVETGITTKSTRHLIERAVQRLVRAGGRLNEGGAPHLLEAISVIAYDPSTGKIDPVLPPEGSGLRWDEFISQLITAYKGRFEG